MQLEAVALNVTVSIGLAWLDKKAIKTPESLLEVADAALYQAKKAGRNRVFEFDQTLDKK